MLFALADTKNKPSQSGHSKIDKELPCNLVLNPDQTVLPKPE